VQKIQKKIQKKSKKKIQKENSKKSKGHGHQKRKRKEIHFLCRVSYAILPLGNITFFQQLNSGVEILRSGVETLPSGNIAYM